MASLDTSLFDIDANLAKAFLNLMVTGESDTHRQYYKHHRMMKDARIIILKIDLPLDRSTKGTITPLPIANETYVEPTLSNEIRRYGKRTYLGYNIYLHPEHERMSREMKDNQTGDVSDKVGIIILKERGCFTFKLNN